MPLGKTANAAWKEAKQKGYTGSFSQFLEQSRTRFLGADGENPGLLLINRDLNDSVQAAINKTLKQGGLKETESGKTVLGLNKTVVIGAAVLITAALVFLIIKSKSNG